MNRNVLRAALVAAAPAVLCISNGQAHAQGFGNPPELLHSNSAKVIALKDTLAQLDKPVASLEINDKTLSTMSESSAVRVACGPGASYSVALSQTTADGPLQMLQQKLLQAGLLFSGVGSTLLLLGAFMRNRRSRLIRSIMLVGLFAYAAITYQPSLGFCVAFPLLALALFDPRTALKTGTLLKTATGRVFGAAVAALTAAITSSVAFSAKVASTTFDLMARCTRAAGGNLPLFAGIAAAMTALSVALAFTASVHKQQFSLLRITPVRNVQRTNRQPVRTIQPVVPIAPIAGPMIR